MAVKAIPVVIVSSGPATPHVIVSAGPDGPSPLLDSSMIAGGSSPGRGSHRKRSSAADVPAVQQPQQAQDAHVVAYGHRTNPFSSRPCRPRQKKARMPLTKK